MKILFLCFLFLSCPTIMWSQSSGAKTTAGDTMITHQVYEIGPELKEESYLQKRKEFKDALFSYLVKQHQEDILNIKDSVVINFMVKGCGRIDSVWLVSPKTYPYENICRFIKRYNFQGPLVEFYTSKPGLYDCTIKLVLLLNRETKMLHISFDFIYIKKRE